jgi:hypothetical protein
LEVGGAIPQTAVILVVARRYSFGLLNFAAHSPEDSQRDRKRRSARLERTVPKGLFQYRTAVRERSFAAAWSRLVTPAEIAAKRTTHRRHLAAWGGR